MSTLAVRCPHCQAICQVAESDLEREIACLECRHSFRPAVLESSSRRSSPWWWLSDDASAPSGPPRATSAPAAEAWKPGDVILDLYEVREVFTSGGRGLVYRVHHRGWSMDLALKCPRPEFFQSEADKADFEREAETWVNLGLHPHLATCHYVRRLEGIPHVFAEYVAGGSLAEWIRSRRLYTGGRERALERLLDVAIQFAWGLQHAHEQGLVHRDVKPGNVLLTSEGIAKVTDFGMARARGVATEAIARGEASILVSSGGLTPAFCSPEQVQGRPVSRRTDIWSWGVSLLHMFMGSTPWSAGYLAGGVLADYRRRGPAENDLPPMPPGLVDLLEHCFRPSPEDRPRDMLEIVATLQRVYAQATGRTYSRPPPQAAKALADSLNNRALSLRDLHKHDEAERLWREALTIRAQHPESTYNLGLTRWRAGRLSADALLQQLRDVCVSHPHEWLPPYLLARAQMEQGEWRAVAQALEHITGAGAELEEVRAAREAARACLAESGRRLHCLTGHEGWVSAVCSDARGRIALSASADSTLRLWDIAHALCLRTFTGHDGWVTAASLGADGALALSGSADRTLRVWRTSDGQCLRVLQGHTHWVLAAALRADGRFAVSGGGDGAVKLWEISTGACVRTFDGHEAPVLAVCWSSDGRHVLSGSRDQTLQVWDADTGERLHTFAGHADKVLAVALEAGGQHALSGSADRTVKLWDLATGRCLRTFDGHQGSVTSVCFSAGGCYVLSGSEDRTVKLWQATTGRCLATMEGHEGTVHSLCLAGSGRRLLSASADRTLRLWGLPADHAAPYILSRVLSGDTALSTWTRYEQALAAARQALAAGESVLAAQRVREARAQPGHGRRPEVMELWFHLYGRLPRQTFRGGWGSATLAEHAEAVTAVCLSSDGRIAVSGSADRTLRLWEPASGRCLHTFEGDMGGITAVCLGRDETQVLSSSTDGALKLWDVKTGHCLRTCREDVDVLTSVALSADGRLAASGSTDGTIPLWDLRAGRLLRILSGHAGPVHSVALSADGRHALSGSALFVVRRDGERVFTSGQLKLWDTRSGRCLPIFEDQAGAVTALCLGLDERHALTGGSQSVLQSDSGRFVQSGLVHLWELSTGRCLRTFDGHRGAVTSVSLSCDGGYALSGSTDATVKLWDAQTGQCLRTFAGHADAVTSVTFSADGRYALSGSADRTLRVWVLDWELTDRASADWEVAAQLYLEMFLDRHVPLAAERRESATNRTRSPLARLLRPAPSDGESSRTNARQAPPAWTEHDFQGLLATLGHAGYGWLRPEGVRQQLLRMARQRRGE